MLGALQLKASSGGIPKPSYRLGNKNTEQALYKAGRSS